MQTTPAIVESIERQDNGSQTLRIAGRSCPAICYTRLSGACRPGDRVLLNIAATQMGLGTGGYDFVVCKLDEVAGQPDAAEDAGGRDSKIMKLRYTPMQCPVDVIEDERSPMHDELCDATGLEGMPVACCGLHSQLPLVAAGIRRQAPDARIVYCMTDEGALMLPFSKLARQCVDTGLVDATITCGQAMGGDAEAVSLHSALVAARLAYAADAAIVAIGPGIAGTGTALGNGGVAQAESVNAVAALGGRPTAVMRVSFADARERHLGASHHFLTAMGRLALGRASICIPEGMPPHLESTIAAQLDKASIGDKHDIVRVDVGARNHESLDDGNAGPGAAMAAASAEATAALPHIDTRGIEVTTMGRSYVDDPWFFLCAYAAGVHVGSQVAQSRCAR